SSWDSSVRGCSRSRAGTGKRACRLVDRVRRVGGNPIAGTTARGRAKGARRPEIGMNKPKSESAVVHREIALTSFLSVYARRDLGCRKIIGFFHAFTPAGRYLARTGPIGNIPGKRTQPCDDG